MQTSEQQDLCTKKISGKCLSFGIEHIAMSFLKQVQQHGMTMWRARPELRTRCSFPTRMTDRTIGAKWVRTQH